MDDRQEQCEYFTARPEAGVHASGRNFVFRCDRPVGEGPVLFFVPVGNGDAVRVPVCEEHAALLERLTAEAGE